MKRYVSTSDDFANEPHWAIIRFTSIHIPGDERSRTNPGHGYPAHTESVVKYEAFATETEWLSAIEEMEEKKRKYGSRESYKALRVEPAEVTTKVQVQVR